MFLTFINQINYQPFSLVPLVALFLFTLLLGKEKGLARFKFSRLLPNLIFFRISILAAILSRSLFFLGVKGELLNWMQIICTIALRLGVVDISLESLWGAILILGIRKTSPPRILKDLIFVATSLIVITVEMNNRGLLTTIGTAAVASVLAFIVGPGASKQIQNISSALAVQVERQFSIGDWVELDGHLGKVDNISWNSTYLYDPKFDRYIVIPNSKIDSVSIVNYSMPSPVDFKLEVDVGLPYELPPGHAIEILMSTLYNHKDIPDPSRASILVDNYGDSSINYKVRFFISDFSIRFYVKSDIRSRIWYAVSRAGYSIPFPIVDLRTSQSNQRQQAELVNKLQKTSCLQLRKIDLFASLTDDELCKIASDDCFLRYSPGEFIVSKGESGKSMYVIIDGTCSVVLGDDIHSDKIITTLNKGDIFGEISALTNAPRTASIKALSHVELQEISQLQIEELFSNNKLAMNEFSRIIAKREAESRNFTPVEQEDFQLSLLQKMTSSFERFFNL
tara:strand:+ start:230 stop:1756 length:1527 start_codon:yes stop_codon:yes gene_type:complete